MSKDKKKQTAKNRSETQNTIDGISEERAAGIRQNSRYNEEDLPAPDNNLFWENESNPLSSKGN